jgi:hypothetical protein
MMTMGRFNAAFEERPAGFLGVKHLITVNSGSSANLVAFPTRPDRNIPRAEVLKSSAGVGVADGCREQGRRRRQGARRPAARMLVYSCLRSARHESCEWSNRSDVIVEKSAAA